MSIRSRLEDAELLHTQGRHDGALLSVLVAVAATSRKRRPRDSYSDGEAFRSFVREEMRVITGGAVGSWNVSFRNRNQALEDVLYTFVRCELAHEASLPSDVHFVPDPNPDSLSMDLTEGALKLSHGWMRGLSRAVQFAPENGMEFPEAASVPPDVLTWVLFAARRGMPFVSEYIAQRQLFAHAWAAGKKLEPANGC